MRHHEHEHDREQRLADRDRGALDERDDPVRVLPDVALADLAARACGRASATLIDFRWCWLATPAAGRRRGRRMSVRRAVSMCEVVVEPARRRLRLADDDGADRQDDQDDHRDKAEIHERDRDGTRQVQTAATPAPACRAAARSARRRGTGRRRERSPTRSPTPAPAPAAGRPVGSSEGSRSAATARRGSCSRCYSEGGTPSPARLGLGCHRRRSARARPSRTLGRTSGTTPLRVSQAGAAAARLKASQGLATVPLMVPPATQLRVREARRQRQEQERNRRRFAVVAAFSLVAVVTGLLAAFGGSGGTPSAGPAPASASRLLPGGPPQPEIIANIGALHIQLPVDQSRVTALGYQGGSEGSLALSPVGTQANQGLLRRARARDLRQLERRPALVPAAGRRRAGDVGDRRRRRAGHRRLLARRRDGRRDRRRRPERQHARLAGRHPADRRAVARRLGLAHQRRPGARRSARPSRPAARGSATFSTSRTPSSRRSRTTRTTPETTSPSRCTRRRPCRRRRARRRLRILFVADVFGSAGRRAVDQLLPGAAAGARRPTSASSTARTPRPAAGITAKIADQFLAGGADVVTLGNWTWGQQGFAPYLVRHRPRAAAGEHVAAHARPRPRGARRGRRDQPARHVRARRPFENAFIAADHLVEEARRETPVIIVDFHAEATSEKVALAQYLDGRVTAVLGTHTHVQTSDARVLAGGTAAITDAGMTGPHDSVIGSVAEGRDQAVRHRDARPPRARDARRPARGRARRVRG